MGAVATINEQQSLVSQELNNQVLAVLSSKVEGFEKAFIMASAIQVLKDRLTPEFMAPIMALQGSNLGFLTDKKGTGYTMDEVKSCLIDAVLLGLQPTGNEFNIIASNMYPTRQGFGSLLKKIAGLKYSITYSNPIFAQDKTSATCKATITWELNGVKETQTQEFPIKSNSYATADAILGKAERKARRWLFNTVNGTDIPDGDVTDIPHTEVSSKQNPTEVSENKEAERVRTHISGSKDYATLIKCEKAIRENDTELWELFYNKMIEIAKTEDELKKVPNDWLLATDSFDKWDERKREIAKK